MAIIAPASSSLLCLHLPPQLQSPPSSIPRRYCPPTQTAASLSSSNNNSTYSNTHMVDTVADRALLHIQNSGVIACLRAHSAEMALEAARAALSGGITVLEIVISTPGVYEVLQQLVLDYPTATLGVGTVINARDAKDAIRCGVKFLMSPAIVMDILEAVADNQALYIPGAMTPTEILSVYNAGAKIVKIYPVSVLGGVQYVAALRKPFSHIPMVAAQGVKIDMIGEYIARGASAVVLSDAIFDMAAMHDKNYAAIHQLASRASFLGSEAVKKLPHRKLPDFSLSPTFGEAALVTAVAIRDMIASFLFSVFVAPKSNPSSGICNQVL